MKKITGFFLIIIALAGCEKWQAGGPYVTRTYEIHEINHLFVNDDINVTLVSDGSNKFELRAPEKLIDGIKFDTNGDTIRFRNDNKHNWLHYEDSIHVTLHVGNRFASINSFGTGHINSSGTLFAYNLLLYAYEGSGIYQLNLTILENLRIVSHSNTTTDFFMSGKTSATSLAVNGRGKINTTELRSSNVSINHSGPNNLYVQASVRLRAIFTGIGNVYYLGNPINVEQLNLDGGTGELIPLNPD